MQATQRREFTGRHMLLIMVTFFSIVIVVNITMAVYASKSWTGLLAKNGYVASIDFATQEQSDAAIEARGWSVTPALENNLLALRLRDEAGLPVEVTATATAVEGDPRNEPVSLSLVKVAPGAYRAAEPLSQGRWTVRFTLDDGAGPVVVRAVVNAGSA